MMTTAKAIVAAGLLFLSGAALAEPADEAAVVAGAVGQMVSGAGPMEEMFEGFFAARFKVHPGAHEVVVAGDTARHLMAWSSPGPDGSTIHALSVAVMTKDADGEWRMMIDHPFGDGVMAADPALAP